MQSERLNHIDSQRPKTEGMHLLYQKEKLMPDTVDMRISRYDAAYLAATHDSGTIAYHVSANPANRQKSLSLKFCLYGNCYCQEQCGDCLIGEKHKTIDFLEFRFHPYFLKKMVPENASLSTREKILSFKYPRSFTKNIPVEARNRQLLDSLLELKGQGDALDNILLHSKVNQLLLYSMEVLQEEEEDHFACPVSVEADFINRLYDARNILLANLSSPVTIKELSRKVAMNECYLKKGFKEVFGTTIFDFYQKERMSYAKYLLYEKGLTVTEVSDLLGYSSISHFSTAFKKTTGLRPCELLFKSK